MDDGISPDQFHASDGVPEWRVLVEGAQAFYRTSSFAESARFVAALAALEGLEDHRPDVDIRRGGVTVRLITKADDWYGPTQRDVVLARRISAVAAELGLAPDPAGMHGLLLIVGAPSGAAVLPFWRAALGYQLRADSPAEDIVDPNERDASIGVEELQAPRGAGGGAIHVATWVPPEEAEARVAAALEAGGRLVRDRAPMWWTLADAAGNEVDISTVQGRG
jgi:4a-hydroxytetrahydrobiopterin dehydratase